MHFRLRASRALLVAVKTARRRQYEIAQRAGLDPALVSKIIHNAIPLKPNDPRVRRLARVVGLSVEDAFEAIDTAAAAASASLAAEPAKGAGT